MASHALYAQTYTIPDIYLKNKLMSSYPYMFNGSGDLIIAQASTLIGAIYVDNSSISNLSGMEYFTSVSSIWASGNNLTSLPILNSVNLKQLVLDYNHFVTLPDLSGVPNIESLSFPNNDLTQLTTIVNYTSLKYLNFSTNQLSYLPDLSVMVNLEKVNINNNQLIQLPSLATLTKLTFFDASYNKLTSVPDLSSLVNLQELYFEKNQLTQLPSLAALTNLKRLSAGLNQLTAFPSLTALTNLEYLNVKNNQITSLPNLSTIAGLKYLICNNNQLNVLPSIGSLVQLLELNCSSNFITSLPSLAAANNLSILNVRQNKLITLPYLSQNTNLTSINCDSNKLTSIPTMNTLTLLQNLDCSFNLIDMLPDFSALSSTCIVNLSYNNLTFEDILPNVPLPAFNSSRFFYPQNYINKGHTYTLKQYTSVNFVLPIDQTVSTNSYLINKNNSSYINLTSSSPVLTFSSIQPTDAATYSIDITNSNPALSGMMIRVFFDTLIVQPCFQVLSLPISQVSSGTCDIPGKVTVNTSAVTAGAPPYTFTLKSIITQQQQGLVGNEFRDLHESKYLLLISDQGGCSLAYESPSVLIISANGLMPDGFPDTVLVNQEENCKTIVITPDGDGISDTYFIKESGNVKIINSSGVLIRQLNAPALWDGSDQSGNVVPGYYIIQCSDKIIPITIVF